MRKLIGFAWDCTESDLIDNNIPVKRENLCEPVGLVENLNSDNYEYPFKMECRRLDEHGLDVGTYNLYLCSRPGFLFDDKTYLRFDYYKMFPDMSKRDFNRYVHEQVIKHMNNDDIPEICNLEDIIF